LIPKSEFRNPLRFRPCTTIEAVTYQEGFEALKEGDFKAAILLLEKAARETGYTSDIINHAYTLALYRTGNKSQLADASFEIANSLLQNDPASAMDYFQRAIFAGLDARRVRRIGEIFEEWAAPVQSAPLNQPFDRVAHVVGNLQRGNPLTRYLRMLTASLNRQGIRSTIFTTEWAASWFFNTSGMGQSEQVEIEASTDIASVEGDFIERAARIADAIRAAEIKVAFFHANLGEQITARVAAMRPAAFQVNVNHGTEMDADLFDAFIHFSQNAQSASRFASHPSEWIPPASDIESRLQMAEPVTRQGMGLESASSVSATFGSLDSLPGGYLKALAEILKRFPKHFHLFAGEGHVRGFRGVLHSEGVLPRVRFLGQVADVAPLLDTIDVYLASYPHPGVHSVIEAMGAGKPVVVLRTAGAEFVGVRELIAAGEAEYIEITDRLLRNTNLRQKMGQAMRDRFRAEFRPDRLGERYAQFIVSSTAR
jgi:glycosyl transferase family 1